MTWSPCFLPSRLASPGSSLELGRALEMVNLVCISPYCDSPGTHTSLRIKSKFLSMMIRRSIMSWCHSPPCHSSNLKQQAAPWALGTRGPSAVLRCFPAEPFPALLCYLRVTEVQDSKDYLLREDFLRLWESMNCCLLYTPAHLMQTLFLYYTRHTGMVCLCGYLLHSEARLGLGL